MKNIEAKIDDYLGKPTDYAIQIVGSWGHGKTFFYRNNLVKLITEKETHNDSSKCYKPIYISLFGLKSIEDIAIKIVLEFYQSKLFKDYFKPGFKKKKIYITQSIFKIGIRGFLNFNMLGNSNEYITDIKKIGENVLDANELVICFDDFERKDSSLNIEDLTGYINSLVDEGVKVIIITNEDLLLKEEGTYKNLKEKIIGITLEYSPNTSNTLLSIINSRYSGFSLYKEFLSTQMELLESFSVSLNNNFRHVIYSLDNLQIIYSLLRKVIIDTKHEISENIKSQLSNISIFTLIFSAEYKSSNIKYCDKVDYSHENNSLVELFDFAPSSNTIGFEENKSNFDTLFEKYNFSKENYKFYETIFNYATGYDEFDINKFIVEFIKKFHLEKGLVLPQYEIYNSLGYQNCFNLSDVEYRINTQKLIEYAQLGLFLPAECLTVMHFSERFDNILGFDLEFVKSQVIEGLKISIEKIKPDSTVNFFQFEQSGKNQLMSQHNKEIYKIGMEDIKVMRKKLYDDKIVQLATLFIGDINEFKTKLETDSDFKNDVCINPFFNYLLPDNLANHIISSENGSINFLIYFLKERYEDIQMLKSEIEFFLKVKVLLINFRDIDLQEKGKTLHNYLINEFIKYVDTLILKSGKI